MIRLRSIFAALVVLLLALQPALSTALDRGYVSALQSQSTLRTDHVSPPGFITQGKPSQERMAVALGLPPSPPSGVPIWTGHHVVPACSGLPDLKRPDLGFWACAPPHFRT